MDANIRAGIRRILDLHRRGFLTDAEVLNSVAVHVDAKIDGWLGSAEALESARIVCAAAADEVKASLALRGDVEADRTSLGKEMLDAIGFLLKRREEWCELTRGLTWVSDLAQANRAVDASRAALTLLAGIRRGEDRAEQDVGHPT